MNVQTILLTAEEFEHSPLNSHWTELVRGEIVEISSTGFEHGMLAVRVGARLLQFIETNQLGYV